MRIAVTDASIFIDLMHIGWVEQLPRLGHTVVTSFEVVAELYDAQQMILEGLAQSGQLQVHAVPDSELGEWKKSVAAAARLSRPDLTVLWLAVQMEAVVLTGDKLMRNTSEKLNLEVHGILWLFDRFLENGLVSYPDACAGLESIMEINQRLPIAECDRRLEIWRNK